MILFRDNDSTYIAADTLFSGLRRHDSVTNNITDTRGSLGKNVTLPVVANNDSFSLVSPPLDSTERHRGKFPGKKFDSTGQDSLKSDSTALFIKEKSPGIKDTVQIDSVNIAPNDSLQDAVAPGVQDTLKQTEVINVDNIPRDSIRYFLGFHHVKIYNDSLQAVSDSMYYSTEDSTFKLFGSPVFWNNQTQVKGDTMHLYTENQKAKRMYVYFNGIVVNKTKEGFYNQMGGRTINGYFKDGAIDYIRVKGSPAESIFYPQDDDSAYVGMNRSKGDVIDIFFINKELNKIKFVNDVDGTMYPLKQIPGDQKFLKNFIWENNRRPKNKLELFE